ncbi:chemotaxis protein CheW [Desulfobacterales bacterium HSG17]|nr:chemotaxis protein CheW [Desulfobacterales bacterium HSG17]
MNCKSNKEILRHRAKLLAKKPENKENQGFCLEIVEFQLAHERYGIEAEYICEVWPLKDFTPLPFTPPFIMGIINVRGQILSLMDIKKFFDLPDKGISDLNKVIIVHFNEMELGILADIIIGVQSVPLSAIQPPLPTLSGINESYLKGITKDRLIILDSQKILSDEKIIVHEKI